MLSSNQVNMLIPVKTWRVRRNRGLDCDLSYGFCPLYSGQSANREALKAVAHIESQHTAGAPC